MSANNTTAVTHIKCGTGQRSEVHVFDEATNPVEPNDIVMLDEDGRCVEEIYDLEPGKYFVEIIHETDGKYTSILQKIRVTKNKITVLKEDVVDHPRSVQDYPRWWKVIA